MLKCALQQLIIRFEIRRHHVMEPMAIIITNTIIITIINYNNIILCKNLSRQTSSLHRRNSYSKTKYGWLWPKVIFKNTIHAGFWIYNHLDDPPSFHSITLKYWCLLLVYHFFLNKFNPSFGELEIQLVFYLKNAEIITSFLLSLVRASVWKLFDWQLLSFLVIRCTIFYSKVSISVENYWKIS